MSQLRIEGNPEELLEFQKFIYEKDNNLEIDEEYALSEGYNKEPIVIALIVALTPIIKTWITEYFKYKTEKYKLSIKDNSDWKPYDVEE